MATKVCIDLKRTLDDSYEIAIGTSLDRAAKEIPSFLPADRYFIITDSNVEKLYGRAFLRSMKKSDAAGYLLAVPAGEKSKNRKTKEILENRLVSLGATRNSAIIALGGGVVGDIAGFVASTFLRGIPYLQIPTTLLAQVDSSVGGKVGVDLPLGKNLVGAFYHPKKIYVDIGTLATLPEAEFANGMAEVVKYAAILDAGLFSYLENNSRKILARDRPALVTVIKRCCELKKYVVEVDERESDYRRVLNFGHTIGHAMESLSRYKLSHGKAISIGMVAESTISVSAGLLREQDVFRLRNLLSRYHLPTAIPSTVDIDGLCRATLRDKKMRNGAVQYTLLRRIGKAVVGRSFSDKTAQRILS